MKFTWGTGIFIFLIIFFISIFWFVYFSFNTQQDLVEEDYYSRELKYNEQQEKQKNLRDLGLEISYHISNDSLVFTFPKNQKSNQIKGQIKLYRPSDKKLDQTYFIELDTLNRQVINTTNLSKGKYIVKIGWAYQQMAYYQEITIIY